MAADTRSGHGPIRTDADTVRFVDIMVARAVRADALLREYSTFDMRWHHAQGRYDTYKQAIAEALGVDVADVDIAALAERRARTGCRSRRAP